MPQGEVLITRDAELQEDPRNFSEWIPHRRHMQVASSASLTPLLRSTLHCQ